MAEDAKLAIIAAPLSRARIPVVVDQVLSKSTPGSSVDLLVTQYGIAVNTAREENRELFERLKKAKLPLRDIRDLRKKAEELNGIPAPLALNREKITGRILNRAEGELDLIYAVK